MSNETLRVGRLGNGSALHIVDASGALCNRWGTVNGTVRAPRIVEGAVATCKRCAKLAPAPAVEVEAHGDECGCLACTTAAGMFPSACHAARTGEGYWTCDVPGMCADCRKLAAELDAPCDEHGDEACTHPICATR